jgi:hypothetical protein
MAKQERVWRITVLEPRIYHVAASSVQDAARLFKERHNLKIAKIEKEISGERLFVGIGSGDDRDRHRGVSPCRCGTDRCPHQTCPAGLIAAVSPFLILAGLSCAGIGIVV